jgi:hypothetical protein
MLEDANGQNCQARNFLRAFSTIPQGNKGILFFMGILWISVEYESILIS